MEEPPYIQREGRGRRHGLTPWLGFYFDRVCLSTLGPWLCVGCTVAPLGAAARHVVCVTRSCRLGRPPVL
jgi:hypothetical protein